MGSAILGKPNFDVSTNVGEPAKFRQWLTQQMEGGRFSVGDLTSIAALVAESGVKRSSVKTALRNLLEDGSVSTLRGHGVVIRQVPPSRFRHRVRSVVFIARSASVSVSIELYALIQDALRRMARSTGEEACNFNFVVLPPRLELPVSDSFQKFVLSCDAAIVGGIRSESETAFLRGLFSETLMPIVLLGSDRTIAANQCVVSSNESDGSGILVKALLKKLVELAALEPDKPRFIPQFFLVTDDLDGRNRKRLEGCMRVLETHLVAGAEPFSWHPTSVWHPEHPLVRLDDPQKSDVPERSEDPRKYFPALKGKNAGRFIGLRILDHLKLRPDGASGCRPENRTGPTTQEQVLPRAVIVAVNSEVAEGLAESCVLRNISVPGEVILAATAGSSGRFGSFLTRSEPDTPAVAESVARFLSASLKSPRPISISQREVFTTRLHLRRSSGNFLHAIWRHSPSLTIKRMDRQTGEITCLHGNPVFEHLSGRPCSEARGKTAVELWGQLAGRPIANYERIVAGFPGPSPNRPIFSAAWLPFQTPETCRFTLRFPIKLETHRFGDARLLGSLGFDISIIGLSSGSQEINLMPLVQYESDAALEYPDEELLDAFFQSIPATVAVRTGRKIFYMNSTYARVIFGEECVDKRSMLVSDTTKDRLATYFDDLAADPRNSVSRVGLHRLVLDEHLKAFKCSSAPDEVGDRWVMRFRIANSLFEDGGEASIGFDSALIGGLARKIATIDVNQPIEDQFIEVVPHRTKGFTMLESFSAE